MKVLQVLSLPFQNSKQEKRANLIYSDLPFGSFNDEVNDLKILSKRPKGSHSQHHDNYYSRQEYDFVF